MLPNIARDSFHYRLQLITFDITQYRCIRLRAPIIPPPIYFHRYRQPWIYTHALDLCVFVNQRRFRRRGTCGGRDVKQKKKFPGTFLSVTSKRHNGREISLQRRADFYRLFLLWRDQIPTLFEDRNRPSLSLSLYFIVAQYIIVCFVSTMLIALIETPTSELQGNSNVRWCHASALQRNQNTMKQSYPDAFRIFLGLMLTTQLGFPVSNSATIFFSFF